MLKINRLQKSIGSNALLKAIDLHVEKGTIYGFIGHNGAGKTTTMRSIVGLTRFDNGQIVIDGKKYEHQVVSQEAIGYLPETPCFYDFMTAIEYLSHLNPWMEKKECLHLIDRVGLLKAVNKRIGTYSRGMKQRLGLAAAIIDKPRLLILDEPTSALDPAGRHELFDLILRLRDEGATIILSTHILDDIEKVCDKIGIIKQGAMVKEGTVEEIMSNYIQPIYDITLEEKVEAVKVKNLERLTWVASTSINGTHCSVTVNDVVLAKQNMLSALAESGMSVTGFHLRQPSLEEVFIKEVAL
jgi:ABC-2 type transport system ATP-binding protein